MSFKDANGDMKLHRFTERRKQWDKGTKFGRGILNYPDPTSVIPSCFITVMPLTRQLKATIKLKWNSVNIGY
jgi:hypothetical protein